MSSSRMVLAVAFISLWLLAMSCVPGPGTGRAFLENKTGIALSESTSACASGVVDSEDCRPDDFGSGEWHKRGNFPPYSVSERAVADGPQTIVAEVRAHYLGSPYYEGDVHAFCKNGVPNDAFPPEGTSMQNYDLAEMIKDRAVKDLAKQLRAALDAKENANANDITSRFEEQLDREVRAKVKAHLLWFVARYPGGRPDITRNDKLKGCIEEQRTNNDASLVTGVAGYIVLDNQIDSTISGESVLLTALDSALSAYAGSTLDPEVKQTLALRWKADVDHVAQIKTARQDLSTVAWPLWFQFQ